MATTLPSDPGVTNIDEATDDPKQGRTDIVGLATAIIAILDALGTAATYNLDSSGGLTVTAKSAGTPDELKIKVQTNGGIALESSGIKLDINGLSTFGSPSLATGDTVAIYDASAAATVRRSISGFLTDIAGTGLAVNGATLETENTGLDFQEFTSSDTWTKPGSGTVAFVQCWGGGGSGGARGSGACAGGGGGAYAECWYDLSDLGGTESVTVGAGGAAVGATSNGNQGGNTSFGSWLTAYGGAGGLVDGTAARGGGGAGSHEAASTFTGGVIGGGDGGLGTSPPGDGDDASTIWGGGGGGGDHTSGNATDGGRAVYGGGGGANYRAGANGGISINSGNGGDQDSVTGQTPSGGGAGNSSTSGAGGDGLVRVTVF